MKEEKKIQQSDIDGAKVRLKPVAGISPLVYLPVLYGLGALLLFFLIFLYPGLRNRGSWLAFDGGPTACAVYLDGSYRGSTARKFFVASGAYEMRIEKRGYAPSTRKVAIGGRVLASLFLPKITRIDYDLVAIDGAANLEAAYADYLSWSLTGKPSALYQVPLPLSEAVGDFFRAARKTGKAPALSASDFVSKVAAATQSSEVARDGLRASILVASGGSPSPLGLAAASRTILGVLGRDGSRNSWLKDIVAKPGKNTEALLRKLQSSAPSLPGPSSQPQGFRSLGPHEYLMFSPGWTTMGGVAPSGTPVAYAGRSPVFGIARTEVTKSQWASFLAANPEWKPENKASLSEKGLVDEDYLVSWSSNPGDEPVTGVSWYAASAYCAWLSKSSASYSVILPSEVMWETAAAAGRSDPASFREKKAVWASGTSTGPSRVASMGYSRIGLADIFGNVWEWSADPFLPYPGFVGAAAEGSLFGVAMPERTVRGGSWANSGDRIDLHSRGGIAPSHSSPFLGFRTAIVQR
jgi:hypothetical protein